MKDLKVQHNAKEKGFSETIHRKNLVIQAGERKLEQKLQELEQKLQEQKGGAKLIQKLETKIAEIEEKLQHAQNAKQIDRETFEAFEDEKKKIISDYEEKLRELENRKKAVNNTLNTTAFEKQKLNEKLKQAKSENESFQSELEQLSIISESRLKLIAKLQMEKKALQRIFENEKELLKTQIQTTQNNYNESVLKIDKLTARNQNLQNEKTRLEREVSAAFTTNKSYEEKIIQLETQITSIDKKLKIAEEEKVKFKEIQAENAENLASAQKKLEEQKKKLELSNQQNEDNLETIKNQAKKYGPTHKT